MCIRDREKGYRKPLSGQRQVDLYSDFYSRNPEFLSTLLTMDLQYNNLMDRLEAMELSLIHIFAKTPE